MTASTGIQKERDDLRAQGLKKCIDCLQTKTLSEFYVASRTGSYQPCCKPCGSKRAAQWRRDNQDGARHHHRAAHLMREYGITPEKYNAMHAEQKGCCAVCRRHASELPRGLVVDHDHETGAVRGLLCGTCNSGIGHLGDDPVNLKSALEYLVRHGAH